MLDLSLLVVDAVAELPALRVGGQQLQADGVVEAFGLLQLLLALLHLGVGHPEAVQQVHVLLFLQGGDG